MRSWKVNPLLHYLQFGRLEGREFCPAGPVYPPQAIFLPIVTGSGGSRWFEIELAFGVDSSLLPIIEIYCNGQKLDLLIKWRAESTLVRAVVPFFDAEQFGWLSMRAALAGGSIDQTIEIIGVRVGWTSAAQIARSRWLIS